MNLYAPNTIKDLLSKYGIQPKKQLGQNFIINRGLVEKMLAAANITSADFIIEIGPGIGTLTKEIAQRAGRVIAIEKDRRLIPALKETLADLPNVELIEADALSLDYSSFMLHGSWFKVVSNLPYYLTAPLIRKFLDETRPQPECMVLMMQKEVAQRICATPPHMTILSLAVQFYAEPAMIGYAKKGSFWPQPNVDSAILRITPKKELPPINPQTFFRVVKAGFLHPRRQLYSNLAAGLGISKEQAKIIIEQTGLNPAQRAETLSLKDWVSLATYL